MDGVHDRARRREDLDVPKAPPVERHGAAGRIAEKACETVIHCRPRHGLRAIHTAGDLPIALAQVDHRPLAFDRDRYADRHRTVPGPVVVQDVLTLPTPIGHAGDASGHEGL